MKQDYWTYNKPLSMTGLGGGATSLSVAGGGIVNPFDDMSNFPGATRVGTSNVIYYSSPGTTYSFTDPKGGASTYRFTVVGGGGATTGDGSGWYGTTGGGGGGAARGEIQTSQTLGINVAQGGGSPIISGVSDSSVSSWFQASITHSANNTNSVKGRGGISYVQAAPNPSGHWLLYGYGGLPGAQGYHSSLANRFGGLSNGYSSSYNGNRSFWLNGGNAAVSSGGGVTVTNGTTEYGGTGGCAAHQNYYQSGIADHPLDGKATYPSNSTWAATAGQSTTYAGPGGGGGSDWDSQYQIGSGAASYAAGAAGGSASGLNTLLSGSGLSSVGGNGSNYSARGNGATYGTIGGGAGGNSRYSNSDSWTDNFRAADGIVIVEYLG